MEANSSPTNIAPLDIDVGCLFRPPQARAHLSCTFQFRRLRSRDLSLVEITKNSNKRSVSLEIYSKLATVRQQ